MGFDLNRDEIKHCIEMVTGLTGTVNLGASELRATIVSYAGTFDLSEAGPIYLRTQNNHVVSLYDNLVFGPWRTTGTAPELSTFQADIHASFAVVGFEPWRPEDLVKRVSFRLEHAHHILTNRDHLKKMENFGSPGAVLSVTEGDVTVRLWYGGVYSNEFKVPTEYWPTIEVEFARGVPIGEFMSYVLDIAQLFSLSVWSYLQPSSLRISPLTQQELEETLRNKNDASDYAVEHVWPRIDIDRSDLGCRASARRARRSPGSGPRWVVGMRSMPRAL